MNVQKQVLKQVTMLGELTTIVNYTERSYGLPYQTCSQTRVNDRCNDKLHRKMGICACVVANLYPVKPLNKMTMGTGEKCSQF